LAGPILLSHLRVKTDFTSRKAKCFLRVTKVKLLRPSSSLISTSTTGAQAEALSRRKWTKLLIGHFPAQAAAMRRGVRMLNRFEKKHFMIILE